MVCRLLGQTFDSSSLASSPQLLTNTGHKVLYRQVLSSSSSLHSEICFLHGEFVCHRQISTRYWYVAVCNVCSITVMSNGVWALGPIMETCIITPSGSSKSLVRSNIHKYLRTVPLDVFLWPTRRFSAIRGVKKATKFCNVLRSSSPAK